MGDMITLKPTSGMVNWGHSSGEMLETLNGEIR